jgi:serine/threonine protein kinase
MRVPERVREALADRYAIERELGRGGMGAVYLARDLRHDRPVARKLLLPESAARSGAEQFEREINFAARLQHPHILTVLDSGTAGEHEQGWGSSGSPCPSSMGNRSATGCAGAAGSLWRTRFGSRPRPHARWTTHISTASFTAGGRITRPF